VTSPLRLRAEQSVGSRIVPGSEPGPFLLILMADGRPVRKAVMEVVHPDLAEEHPVAKCSVSQLMPWFSELTPSKQAGK